MSLPHRLLELLDRYPDDLTDAELAELRTAAQADPRLDRALSEAVAIDAAISGTPDAPEVLSELGSERLRQALEPYAAWGSPPAAPLEAKGPGPQKEPADKVISLFARRPVQLALAALVLVTVGVVIVRMGDPVDGPRQGSFKGDPRLAETSLVITSPEGAPVASGSTRAADQPVRFQVRLIASSAYLALLEIQGASSALVWPTPDAVWLGADGFNILQPPGVSPDYQPARPGEATYVVYASPEPLVLSSRTLTEDDLRAANPKAVPGRPLTVIWTPAEQ